MRRGQGPARCGFGRAIDAHFGGRLAVRRERALRAHLVACDDCRRRYERHLVCERLDPAALGPAARLARGIGLEPPRRSVPPVAWGALGLVGAAALLILQVGVRPPGGGFTARGGAAAAARPEVAVFRLPAGSPTEAPQPAGGVVFAGDELAFAYRNPSAARWLMIYGTDEHGHLYWYHPAWEQAESNPRAIAIEPGPALRELPFAVSHPLDGRWLELHALFLDRPLGVREVEAARANVRALFEWTTRLRVLP